MDTGDFARFHPVQIRLVDQGTTEKMIRRFEISSLDPEGVVSDTLSQAEGIAGNASDKAEDLSDKADDLKDDIIDKGSEIIDEVGDKIGDVRKVIEQVITKVLATIETELNDWIRKVADSLGNMDIAQKYSLHVSTFCKVARGNFSSDNAEPTHSGGETSCSYLFSSGENGPITRSRVY